MYSRTNYVLSPHWKSSGTRHRSDVRKYLHGLSSQSEMFPSSARETGWGLLGMKGQERELIQLCVLPSSLYWDRETCLSFTHITEHKREQNRGLREPICPIADLSPVQILFSPRFAVGATSWPVCPVVLLRGVLLPPPPALKQQQKNWSWLTACPLARAPVPEDQTWR